MTWDEYNNLKIVNSDGIFLPNATWNSKKPILDEQDNILDYELVGYAQTKTAEGVYQKYLADKANPPNPQPTDKERIAELENVIAEMIKAGV